MNNLISVFNKAIEYIEEKIKNSEEITNKNIYIVRMDLQKLLKMSLELLQYN